MLQETAEAIGIPISRLLFDIGLVLAIGWHVLLIIEIMIHWCIKFITDGAKTGGNNRIIHYSLRAIGCPGYGTDKYGETLNVGFERTKWTPIEWAVICASLVGVQ